MEQQQKVIANGKSVIRWSVEHILIIDNSGFTVKDFWEVSEIDAAAFCSWIKRTETRFFTFP